MRPSVLIVMTSLGGGGAEKHVVRILGPLATRFQVHLALGRCEGPFLSEVPSGVVVHSLRSRYFVTAGPKLARLVLKTQPDILMPVLDLPNFVAAGLGALLPSFIRPWVVLNVQANMSQVIEHHQGPSSRLLYAGVPHVFPRADRVIAISEGVKLDLLQRIPRLQGKVSVIHNAGVDSSVAELAQAPVSHPVFDDKKIPVIVACGRLNAQKGYPTLLDAFARVASQSPAHLAILGQGPAEAELRSKVQQLGLEQRVHFLGFDPNPFRYLHRSTVFVLSSVYEGFANVIVEALACGLPVVSTDCPSGPAEILQGGEFGRLVPTRNPDALAQALLELLNNPNERKRLARLGLERAKVFSAERVGARYADYFSDLLSQPR